MNRITSVTVPKYFSLRNGQNIHAFSYGSKQTTDTTCELISKDKHLMSFFMFVTYFEYLQLVNTETSIVYPGCGYMV